MHSETLQSIHTAQHTASYFKTNPFAVDNMMAYYIDAIAPKIFKCVYSYREPNYLFLILRRESCRSLLTNRMFSEMALITDSCYLCKGSQFVRLLMEYRAGFCVQTDSHQQKSHFHRTRIREQSHSTLLLPHSSLHSSLPLPMRSKLENPPIQFRNKITWKQKVCNFTEAEAVCKKRGT